MFLRAILFVWFLGFVSLKSEETIIFIGTPGAGKSTLLSGLVGEAVFRGGVAFDGMGITREVQKYKKNGITYIDTPGMDDAVSAVAQEIITLLRKTPKARLFFVMRIESGKIQGSDLKTMRFILGALEKGEYGIILNGVRAGLNNKLNKKKIKELLNEGVAGAKEIFYYPHRPELEGKDNAVPTHDKAFRDFVQSIGPSKIIVSDKVETPEDKLVRKVKKAEEEQAYLQFQTAQAKGSGVVFHNKGSTPLYIQSLCDTSNGDRHGKPVYVLPPKKSYYHPFKNKDGGKACTNVMCRDQNGNVWRGYEDFRVHNRYEWIQFNFDCTNKLSRHYQYTLNQYTDFLRGKITNVERNKGYSNYGFSWNDSGLAF